MNATRYIFLLSVLLSCVSCERLGLCHDQELTLDRNNYTGKELRIDGFYYGRPDTDYQGTVFYEIFVLYNNGVLLLAGVSEYDNMEESVSGFSFPGRGESKCDWGIFKIVDKTIKLEHLGFAQCGKTSIYSTGEILNDTTFVLKKLVIRDSQGIEESNIDDEFHFRYFDAKPDSTNNIIK